ncbi:pyrroline-5-carboxylate reductase [Algimonas porphyrae]|uniref:Pyrroline-5-carboxylate reductase n=1 Tax=Algimonas porphyrae TaxID=1128113 RepID=A0ABQ5UY72_9PROT|nr:pyrroline-5-carboxylate reductase [Algimonas porphyrae]GLQ20253.1 pyrroline-5-carboxylate reductase [Algimonas porphyrae]
MAQTHLIVGAGNMGGALLSSWVGDSLVNPRNLVILDPKPGSEAVYLIERGARHIEDADDIPKSVRVVLLAIKPQLFTGLSRKLAAALPAEPLIISIMAGTATDTLARAFPDAIIVRAMPNTPAAVGRGITAYAAGDSLSEEQAKLCEALLGANGEVIRVADDRAIDAVTAISGSGPAYIFHLCEALTDAAMQVGFDAKTAAQLARATLTGSSALLEASERSATELREAVTSPGGTTQAALDVLMADGALINLMRQTVQAAFDRAQELSG